MKSCESLLKKLKTQNTAFLVCHVSGLYVGEKSDKPFHWLLCALPENAHRFGSKEEAEAFIALRPYWLQKFLSVEKICVYANCTQEYEQPQHLEHSSIAPWK
jgi:hypothetical protein